MANFDTVKSVFDFWFNFEQTKEIIYNPKWANGTGYFDFIVEGEHVPCAAEFGTRMKFVDDKGRRGIVINTPVGNIVVFERYEEKSCRGDIFVLNIAAGFGNFYLFPTTGNMLRSTSELILGDPDHYDRKENIGTIIESIIESAQFYAAKEKARVENEANNTDIYFDKEVDKLLSSH